MVDDEPTNAEILSLLLSREGHQVTIASDGPSGVEAALRLNPDMVFMDVLMPGDFDGLEAIRRIKDAPSFTGIVICQSARASGADQEEGMVSGADGYLIKPFKRRDVLDLIAQFEDRLS
ncbi:response regulator [bacterium]|nr:response regulator [bacterium]